MAAKKKKAVKKSGSKGLMTMEQMEAAMAAEADLDAARLGSGGSNSSLSIKGGSFTFKEADLGTELDCIILDFVNINEWYDRPFSDSNEGYVPPACCAISRDEPADLVPFTDSPVRQEDACCDCEFNDFGSADNGKGKRCGNKRGLLIMVPDDLNGSVDDVELAFLKIPSTSIKAFDKHIKGLAKVVHRPCYGVITTISFDDEPDYPKLKFSSKVKIGSAEDLTFIQELRKMHMGELMEQPDFSQYEEPVAKKSKKKKGKSKLGRK